MTKEYVERGALEAKAVYMHGFGKNKYVPLKAIQQAPAADVVEVKHGRWDARLMTDIGAYWVYWCSECNNFSYFKYDYCPNCGAKMDGGADNG